MLPVSVAHKLGQKLNDVFHVGQFDHSTCKGEAAPSRQQDPFPVTMRLWVSTATAGYENSKSAMSLSQQVVILA